MSVAAIIVTCNRLESLKKTISAAKEQSLKPDSVIIVNNASTDGTKEYLAGLTDVVVINQDNMGSSGGQFSGIKYAFENNFDWIWCLEDDITPEYDCLEKLLEYREKSNVLIPVRRNIDDTLLDYTGIKMNFENIFCFNHKEETVCGRYKNYSNIPETLTIQDFTFEGLLIQRKVIENVGFPKKEIFVYGDDTDYAQRVRAAGEEIFLIKDAVVRRLFPIKHKKIYNWKDYYVIRNTNYLGITHGKCLLSKVFKPPSNMMFHLFRTLILKKKKMSLFFIRILYYSYIDSYKKKLPLRFLP